MRPITLSLICLASLAFAANSFKYDDGNAKLSGTSGRVSHPEGSPNYDFELRGNVIADSKKEGLHITAQRVVGTAVPSGKETKIQKATATGGAHVVKTATTGVSTLTANQAVYQDRGNDALVTLTGSVVITSQDNAKHRSFNATGPNGTATLDPKASGKSKSSLRTATLSGGVRVTMDDAKSPSQYVATGNRLVLDNMVSPATITLTGGVTVTGKGTLSGERAVLRVNAKGEVVGFEVGS